MLTVDNVTHVGYLTLSPFFMLAGGPFYVGRGPSPGDPGAVTLHNDLPVKTALVGGILSLSINDQSVNSLIRSVCYGTRHTRSKDGVRHDKCCVRKEGHLAKYPVQKMV